jgi:phage shock protein A
MNNKLNSQIEELDARRDSIKAKVAAAKVQEKINKMGSSVAGVQGNLSAFDRMEEKANRMMDEAEAMSQLNNQGEDKIGNLMDKYDTPETSVEDELNALKSNLDSRIEEELAKLKGQNE